MVAVYVLKNVLSMKTSYENKNNLGLSPPIFMVINQQGKIGINMRKPNKIYTKSKSNWV